ncbi:MAG: MopE-related protein [Polyangiaceae bacterium]
MALLLNVGGAAGCNGCGSEGDLIPEPSGPVLCVSEVGDTVCVDDGEPLDWGVVAAGDVVVRSLRVSNPGDQPLILSSVDLIAETPDVVLFDVELCRGEQCAAAEANLGATVQPNDSLEVKLTFSVETDGLFPAESLRVLHNDAPDGEGVYLRPFVGTIDGCRDGFTDANSSIDDGCECELIPGAVESCDGIDNDCNGVVDDGIAGTGIACNTGLLGECETGETACVDGVFGCASVTPAVDEICDGLDNDCDGDVDESGSWSSFDEGMSGGNMNDVAYDPRHPGVVYAISGTRVYRSTDDGKTFAFQGEAPHGMQKLAFPPNDDMSILATSGGGLLRSLDDGETWSVISLGGLAVKAIMIHPANPSRIFVGSLVGGGIFRSTNGGSSFAPVNEGVPYAQVTDFEGDASDVNQVVASLILLTQQGTYSTSGVILRTANGGINWTTVLQGIGGAYGLGSCPSTPGLLYAAVQTQGLHQSSDGGQTWAAISQGNSVVLDVAVAASDCATLYTSVQLTGVFRSVDGGSSVTGPLATGMDVQFPSAVKLAVDPTTSNRVLAANHSGLFVTEDGGASWSRPPEINAATVTKLAVSPADPGRIWLSSWGQGVWSRTLSSPWSKVSISTLPRDYIATVVPDPDAPSRVAVGAWTDLFLSEDSGSTFVGPSQAGNPYDIAFDPTNPQIIYVATQTAGIFKSVDGGQTWSAANNGLPAAWATGACVCQDVRDLWIDPNNPSRLVAATNGRGIYRSDDGAQSWQLVTPMLQNNRAGCLTSDGSLLYACVSGEGLWASSDDGATFLPVTLGNSDLSNVGGIVVDDATSDLYATSDFGVFSSIDAGNTWEPVDNECLPSAGAGNPVIIDDGAMRQIVVSTGGGIVALPL